MLEIVQNQLIPGVPDKEYHTSPGMSASKLQDMRECPAWYDWIHNQGNKDEDTDALQFGSLFHAAIENGEKFMDSYLVEPEVNRRTNAGKVELAAFRAANKGKLLVKPEWADQLVGMLTSVNKNKLVSRILKDGLRETSLWTTDNETGELIKCRPDFITKNERWLVDIKTTRSANPRAFKKAIDGDEFLYALQAAHYAHCARMSGVADPDSFTFIAVCKTPPYLISVHTCGIGVLGFGDQWRSSLMKTYTRCKATGVWPGYNDGRAILVEPSEFVRLPPSEDA